MTPWLLLAWRGVYLFQTTHGWKYAALIGGLVGSIALAAYPVIIDPMINPEKWKKIQEQTRKNIRQEDIQPGNMKVWTDPFDRKKDGPESSK